MRVEGTITAFDFRAAARHAVLVEVDEAPEAVGEVAPGHGRLQRAPELPQHLT